MWNPGSGNSWENPVTIKAYKNEKVIVKPLPGSPVFQFENGKRYIIMDGFTIDAQGGTYGIWSGEGSHHFRILNSEVMNGSKTGIITSKYSEYHEFINLKVHDNGSTDLDHGFYISTSKHLVKDCLIFRNSGWGVHIYSGSGNSPSYNKIVNNKIYDNNRAGQRGRGLGIYSGTQNVAINNLIWGNLDGIHVDYGASATKIYHNTVYADARYGIWLGSKSDAALVKNNLIYIPNASYGLMISQGSGASIVENNLIVASTPVAQKEPNANLSGNLVGNSYNPGFVDATNHDFRLTNISSAIGRGLVIPEVETDFDGVQRNPRGASDIGAYAFGTSLAPPTSLEIISHR